MVGGCSKGGGNKSPNTGIPAQLILDDVTQMGIKTTLSTKEHNTKHSKHSPNQKYLYIKISKVMNDTKGYCACTNVHYTINSKWYQPNMADFQDA